MQELPPNSSKEESKSMMRAAVFLISRALKDKVFAVFTAGLNLLKLCLVEFVPNQKYVHLYWVAQDRTELRLNGVCQEWVWSSGNDDDDDDDGFRCSYFNDDDVDNILIMIMIIILVWWWWNDYDYY